MLKQTIFYLLKISLIIGTSGCAQQRANIKFESLCQVNFSNLTCNDGVTKKPISTLDKTKKWYLINDDDLTDIYVLTIESK